MAALSNMYFAFLLKIKLCLQQIYVLMCYFLPKIINNATTPIIAGIE